MAFATARRRWRTPAARKDVARVAAFAVCLPMVAGILWRFIAAPRAITLYTMGINQSASGAATNVTPSTSIWPAGGMAAAAPRPLFADRSTPTPWAAAKSAGWRRCWRRTWICAGRSAAAAGRAYLGGRNGWREPRADRRGGCLPPTGRGEVKAVWIMNNPVVSLPATATR